MKHIKKITELNEAVSTTSLKDYEKSLTESKKIEDKIKALNTQLSELRKESTNKYNKVLSEMGFERKRDSDDDYFNVLNKVKHIRINNQSLVEIQAFVGAVGELKGLLSLNVVSGTSHKRANFKSERKKTLFVLIHEIAHLRGINDEDKEDQFALDNIDKVWGSMIKE